MKEIPLVRHGKQAGSSGARNAATARHSHFLALRFADPLARQLYAEIASIEEQHVTQYESII